MVCNSRVIFSTQRASDNVCNKIKHFWRYSFFAMTYIWYYKTNNLYIQRIYILWYSIFSLYISAVDCLHQGEHQYLKPDKVLYIYCDKMHCNIVISQKRSTKFNGALLNTPNCVYIKNLNSKHNISVYFTN
jgi:hypothetical protein